MKLIENVPTVSLVGFCPICFKNNQPNFGTPFLTYGRHQHRFHIYFVENHGTRGFTPHLIQYKRVGENVIYTQSCGICDIDFWKAKGGEICFDIINSERRVMSLKEWNSWLSYKTDSDYFI